MEIMVVPEIMNPEISEEDRQDEHLDAVNSVNGSLSEEEKANFRLEKKSVYVEDSKENEPTNPETHVKYCTTCHINQPIRAKHCRKCQRCVATYDHHCPFLGNCIGEKNRHLFFAYILMQSLESALLCIVCTLEKDSSSLTRNIDNILIGVIGMAIFLYTASLLLCHSVLAFRNLTTYEILRWNKITYLNSYKKCRSPFSNRCCSNLRDYCCPKSVHKDWKI